jgi:hypothetical protein
VPLDGSDDGFRQRRTGRPERAGFGDIGFDTLPRPDPIAFKSAPAQNVPFAPDNTATLNESSVSKAVNASNNSLVVGPSIALRASGRSMLTIRIGPSCVR